MQSASEKYGIPVEEFIDFSSNINPFGPPPAVLDEIKQNLAEISHYPDPDCRALRKVLSEYLDLPPEQILVGNGAVEIIYLIVRWKRPERVSVPAPTFVEYEKAARLEGSSVNYIFLQAERNFQLQMEQIEEAVEHSDLLFLCNPNNPVGNTIPRPLMEEIIRFCDQNGVLVVVDESFIDFLPNSTEASCRRLIGRYSNLLLVYSLTKFFALPGLRLGCGLGPEKIMKALAWLKDPWSVNCFAQRAGIAALKSPSFGEKTRELITQERNYLMHNLGKIPGCKPYPAEANFILMDISGMGLSAPEMVDRLGTRGILVRDCSSFVGLNSHYIRVAVKDRQANDRLLHSLEEIGGKRVD
ncbi:threonine-phosphate decarboxylase CobD [Calderihabitans maritimus]|uniref:threonine-phosphate decarboxylase CobD n=1 Tax=Calderihabitans maritimus TaxID=1246530 RepID=UPI001EDD8ED8|nr:threonine-phosphate decarboxylase CobD [Calderihabitans maritimus]